MELRTVFKSYRDFLTTPISPVPLGVFRCLFAAVLLANAAFMAPDIQTWFSDTGVLPLDLARQQFGEVRLNLFTIFGSSPDAVLAIFAVHCLAAVCLLFGIFGRLAPVTLFLTMVSFHHRNIYVLHSGDTLMRLYCFFLMFADSTAALSVDRWIAVRFGREDRKVHRLINPLPVRLIQMQLCLVYFAAFFIKATGTLWQNGNAVFVVQQVGEFDRFPVPEFFKAIWASKILTWYTLLVEGLFAFLVWFKDTRILMLVGALFLHVGLEYSMNIQLFQPTITSAFLLFITAAEYQAAADFVKRRLQRRAAGAPMAIVDGGEGDAGRRIA